jgi:hypothetical protein
MSFFQHNLTVSTFNYLNSPARKEQWQKLLEIADDKQQLFIETHGIKSDSIIMTTADIDDGCCFIGTTLSGDGLTVFGVDNHCCLTTSAMLSYHFLKHAEITIERIVPASVFIEEYLPK